MSSWLRFIRNAARPVIDPVWYRVWSRIEDRLAPIEARLAELNGRRGDVSERADDDPASWDQLVPRFLNAVSTVEAFGHALRGMQVEVSELREQVHQTQSAQDLAAVWHRIEFVRREMMFEQRYGRGAASSPVESNNLIAARVVDTAKLEAMRNSPSGVRLNLGCGHIPLDGYLNVDQRDLPGVDVVAAVGDLPFDPNTVTEISSAHLLEHFPEEMLRRNLLPYWHSLMRPGGCFRATVPDGQAMLSKVAVGEMLFDDFREVLFGAQDYDGDFHYNMFTPASLTSLLEAAGFQKIAVPTVGRRNGKCYEFEIVCQRP